MTGQICQTGQEAFLKAFHARHPAVTTEAFAGARAADGRSSYAILRDLVAGRRRVLDLGCGDGSLLELLAATPGRRLAGVDLSPDSLALARRRPALSTAALAEARAQYLPFPDDGFDACVSHLALMLMADIERVVAELARVLVPGGLLACVTGAGGGGAGYELLGELLPTALERTPPARRMPTLGDRRTRHPEHLASLLTTAGFAAPDQQTVPLDLSAPPEHVWTALSGLYDFAALDTPALTALREQFLTHATDRTTPSGALPCHFRVHVTTASPDRQ
ncbi:class I SAM-dependent methyltransferase [Streptomyces sp. LP11]|uniref:Class I SAM-dependent methyltransferase n=1 Tax=Streptomyces pyxinicus TaxID=2970331 RepID=A0ABT2AWU6_9ACTN|nr:class I SAM-dependent methyltransferase [Streptomyces sp. LP11]MCS0600360.1 class I SAM-dependent methyltransferase [Streptomyces sp. LP11]